MSFPSQDIESFLKEMLLAHFPHTSLLKEACQLSESDMEDLYEKAYNHYSSGDGKLAAETFGLLISLHPFKQSFWMGLGASHHLQKEFNKALQAYALAALLDDQDPAPHFHAAQCYLLLDNPQDAIKALELAEAHASIGSQHASFRLRILQLKESLPSSFKRRN